MKKTEHLILLIIFTLLSFVFMTPREENDELGAVLGAQNEIDISKLERYRVVEVVDGDTFTVNYKGEPEKIRLIGVNTPETQHPQKPVECFGQEASKYAKKILNNQYVYLAADGELGNRGYYDRLLRYVFLEDGTNFNELMIKEGYAFEYTYGKPYLLMEQFKAAENHARENKLGLWDPEICSY